jgi:hypothetical protein
LPGVGPTKAGKILARKRPLLVPIYDEVVATFLRPTPGQFWIELRAALQDEARRKQLNNLVDGNESGVGTLRALDVAIWMRCGRSERAVRARDLVGLPGDPLRFRLTGERTGHGRALVVPCGDRYSDIARARGRAVAGWQATCLKAARHTRTLSSWTILGAAMTSSSRAVVNITASRGPSGK